MNEHANHTTELRGYFQCAGSYGKTPEHHMSGREKRDYEAAMRMKGVLRLKRELLGSLLRKETEKTLDELADALVDSGIIDQAKQVHAVLQRGLLDNPFIYGRRFGARMELIITRTEDNTYRCRIQKHKNQRR